MHEKTKKRGYLPEIFAQERIGINSCVSCVSLKCKNWTKKYQPGFTWATLLLHQMLPQLFQKLKRTHASCLNFSGAFTSAVLAVVLVKSVRRPWWFYAASHLLRPGVFVAKWGCLHSPAPDASGESGIICLKRGLNLWLEIFIDDLKPASWVSSRADVE